MADNKTHLDEVLKGRFCMRVFADAVSDINTAQIKYMNAKGFENPDWYTGRDFKVSETALEYSQLLKHRFVDMKVRESKTEGRQRKKSHPIHNRIIWGNYNNIVREMSVGFTEAVKEQLRQIEN